MDYEDNRREVLEIADAKDKTLLDIGTGPLTTIAAKEFNCPVTSIDVDEEKIEEEKQNAKAEGVLEKIDFQKADALNMHFPDKKFDIAISYGALHHINEDEREKFIDEAVRVSKRTIIADFGPETFPHDDEYKMVDFSWLEKKLSGFKHNYYFINGVNVYIIE